MREEREEMGPGGGREENLKEQAKGERERKINKLENQGDSLYSEERGGAKDTPPPPTTTQQYLTTRTHHTTTQSL